MAQRFPFPSGRSLDVFLRVCALSLFLLSAAALVFFSRARAQTSSQQYVYGSIPVTTATSQVTAFVKNGTTGTLSAVTGSPFNDGQPGGAAAIDGQGRFLFVINPQTSSISMFAINQSTGGITEVPGSPFANGSSPLCLATEKTGQFLYVGSISVGTSQYLINEYSIDATNQQILPLSIQTTTAISASPIGMIAATNGSYLYAGLGPNVFTATADAGTNVYSIAPSGALTFVGNAGGAQETGRSIALDPESRFFFDGWGELQGYIDSAPIDPANGTASSNVSTIDVGQGGLPDFPHAMLVDTSGRFLYVQQTDAVYLYLIDQTTGQLTPSPNSISVFTFSTGTAVSDPLGPYLYSSQSDGLHGFEINPQNGALAELTGSPFSSGPGGSGLAISGAPQQQASSAPVAGFFPSSESFGNTTLGQSSAGQTVSLTNTGGQGLDLNSLTVTGADATDFTATPNCPAVLNPGGTCYISVVFNPSAVGVRQAQLTASDNAAGTPQSVPLSGEGVAPPSAISISPQSLSFATTAEGNTTASQTVTITSTGTGTLHISSVSLGGLDPNDFAMQNGCGGAYATNTSCMIGVTFSPLAAGQRTATIMVYDDAPNSPQTIPLAGTGSAPTQPVVSLSPTSISFGTVTQGSTSSSQTLTVTNRGGATLHISSVALGGNDPGDFTMTNGCNGAYAINASCTISLTFSPLSTGNRSATITITDDAPNSPQVVSVTGNVNPAFSMGPTTSGGTSQTISAGQTATYNLQLVPGSGFTGSVSFACSNVPQAATCTAPSVTVSNSNTIPFTVTISTTSSGVLPRTPHLRKLGPGDLRVLVGLNVILVLLLTLPVLGAASKGARSRFSIRGFALASVIGAAFVMASCGGGSSDPAAAVVVTPQGTYTITVTPSATTTGGKQLTGLPTIQLTLIVN